MIANDIDRMKRAACSSIPCRVLSLVAQGCVCDPICRLRICYQFWCLSRRRSVRVVLRRVIIGTTEGCYVDKVQVWSAPCRNLTPRSQHCFDCCTEFLCMMCGYTLHGQRLRFSERLKVESE